MSEIEIEEYVLKDAEFERLIMPVTKITQEEYKNIFKRWAKLKPYREIYDKLSEIVQENKNIVKGERIYYTPSDYDDIITHDKIFNGYSTEYRKELNEYGRLECLLKKFNSI